MKKNDITQLTLENELLFGTLMDLSQPLHLNGVCIQNSEDFSEDIDYIIKLHFRITVLEEKLCRLIYIYSALAFDDFPIKTTYTNIPRHEWIKIVIDSALNKFTSIRDCTYYFINELLELNISKNNLRRKTLLERIENKNIAELVDSISKTGKELRNERNYNFHEGLEIPIGDDPDTFQMGSILESFGKGISGKDRFGNKIDIPGIHEKIVVNQISIYNEINRSLHEKPIALLNESYPEFKKRFLEKYKTEDQDGNNALYIIERNEKYNSQ